MGISAADVIKTVMLKDTVNGKFTTMQGVAEVALLFAGFESNVLTDQSLVMSRGWFMPQDGGPPVRPRPARLADERNHAPGSADHPPV